MNYLVMLLSSKEPFDYLKNTAMTTDSEIQMFSQSAYILVKVICLFLFVCGISIAAVMSGVYKNAKKRQENKEKITKNLILVVVLFAIPFILTVIYDIAKSFA